MYWKKNKKQKEDLQIVAPLILNSQSQMTGDFIIHTDVKIDGYVQGNVITTKSVIIGENGHLKGKLKCKTLMVFGTFEGISDATESACLQSTAEYIGKLTTPIVSIFPGCRVNAYINQDYESVGFSFDFLDNGQELSGKSKDSFNDTNNKTVPDTQNTPGQKTNSFLFKNLNK
jgi:cytoskeletal protein CcmA (bactofilin family)